MGDNLEITEDEDIAEGFPLEDPVVRMPKSMAAPVPEPPGIGGRLVLTVALVGALLGAGLGAVGIGIVVATRVAVVPSLGVARVRPHRRAVTLADAPARPSAAGERVPPSLPEPAFAGAGAGADGGTVPSVDTHDPAAEYETAQQPVGHGRTLAGVFRALAVEPQDAVKAIHALGAYVNLRALQPMDRVVALRDPVTHDLRRVEYRRSPTQVFAAVRASDGVFRGERVEATLATVQTAAGFRVQGGSVEASVRAAGLHVELIPRLAEILPAIDLPDHLHGGDVVRFMADQDLINGGFFRYGRVYGVDYRGALGHRRAYWFRPGTRVGDWFDPQGQTWPRGPLRSPVPGARISSRFDPHRVHPVLHVVKPHNGMDFAAPTGTAVYAAAAGVVLSVGPSGPSGNLVRLRHPALGVETGYAHLSRFAPGLRPGQPVRARQLVGYVGTTGRSTGPHLHFSVKRNGRFIDPESLYGGRRGLTGQGRTDFDAAARATGDALDGVAVDGVTLRPPGTVSMVAGSVAGTPPEAVADGGGRTDPSEAPVLDEGTDGTPEDEGEGEGEEAR